MIQAAAPELRRPERPPRPRVARPSTTRAAVRPPPQAYELDAVNRRHAAGGQRRCACGGIVGPTGECAACRVKRERAAGAAGAVAATREAAGPEEPKQIGGVLVTNVMACYGAGAESVCDVDKGTYEITANANTCASRSCSQAHEERHVADLGSCCRKLSTAVTTGGDRGALVERYNDWLDGGARAWSECKAYGLSLRCVELLLFDNRCGLTKSSTACDELRDYRREMTAQRDRWCAQTPSELPACPFR